MTDQRPLAAAGHLFFNVADARTAAKRLVNVGLREIFVSEKVVILELRGGTHMVVKTSDSPDEETPTDLMYDSLDNALKLYRSAGFKVGELVRGSIHDEFWATAPEGFRVHVNSSHVSDQPV